MIKASDIRKSMRISHDGLDDDIQRNMNACLLDMKRVGISPDADDQLIDKAVEIYCKAQNDYQGKGSEYQVQYERLRDAMSLCQKYRQLKKEENNV